MAESQHEPTDIAAQERRLREATTELLHLARTMRGDDLPAALRGITEVGARACEAMRCTVWLLDGAKAHLELVEGYDSRRPEPHFSGEKVPVARNHTYLESLVTQRLLAVSDVRSDPRTRDFAEAYFGTVGVTSTIDVVVRARGDVAGAICVEHVGAPRHWTAAEEAFAGALADLASLALESAERYRIELALVQSDRRFRDLFQYSSDSIVLVRIEADGTAICEDINQAAEKLSHLSRAQVIGKRAHEVLEPLSAGKLDDRYRQCVQARGPIVYEHDLQLPSGRKWFNTALIPLFDDTGRIVRLAAIARDVTALHDAAVLQRSLEAQMAEAQKNEALARLASHIAHDVNNLLTVIVAHAQRLEGVPGRAAEVSQAILQATARGRELTQQVLTFGRRRPADRRPLKLGPLVHEALKLLEPTAPTVAFRADVTTEEKVLGDSGQLMQVLTNLCSNAISAMPRGGTLTVRLEVTEVSFAFAQQHPPMQAGRYVLLSVSDTGVGMNEETRRRIFEPFFSARESGAGTGLGLAVVQGLVEGHDGAVLVETAPGAGSTFRVYLPALEEEVARPGAGQHLMLVDDHPGMARVSAKLLETLGYRTSVFDDPREALEAFRAAPGGFDAVLTDLSMPQMSGEEFTRSLHALSATTPVIVSSGLASELDAEQIRRLGVAGVLMKPWRVEEAVATLKRVLAR